MLAFNSSQLVSATAGTSSKGNQRKWMARDGSMYVKERFQYQDHFWRDDLVEVITAWYATLCNTQGYGVPVLWQEPCTVDGRPAVCSQNFAADPLAFISFQRLCDRAGESLPNYLQSSVYDNFEIIGAMFTHLTRLNMYPYLLAMATLDTIVGNEDRHLHNFGVLHNRVTDEYCYAPLFDFGLGLFEHDNRYAGRGWKDCLPLMQCKPFALDSEEVVDFLCVRHRDFLKGFLPAHIDVSAFAFPSERAESYFRNRNLLLGVKL